MLLASLASESDEGVVVDADADVGLACFRLVPCSFSGVLLRVREGSSVSSGMVANFLRTCLRAGRRIGLLCKGLVFFGYAESEYIEIKP